MEVTDPTNGSATVRFSLGTSSGPGDTWSSATPVFTNVCNETVWVEMSADGYMTVTNQIEVVIKPRDIAEASVPPIKPRTYKGSPQTPVPKSVMIGNLRLEAGLDYTLTWESNVNQGIAAVVLTGRGEYCGTKRLVLL